MRPHVRVERMSTLKENNKENRHAENQNKENSLTRGGPCDEARAGRAGKKKI